MYFSKITTLVSVLMSYFFTWKDMIIFHGDPTNPYEPQHKIWRSRPQPQHWRLWSDVAYQNIHVDALVRTTYAVANTCLKHKHLLLVTPTEWRYRFHYFYTHAMRIKRCSCLNTKILSGRTEVVVHLGKMISATSRCKQQPRRRLLRFFNRELFTAKYWPVFQFASTVFLPLLFP